MKKLPVLIIVVVLVAAVAGGVFLMQKPSGGTPQPSPPGTQGASSPARSAADEAPPAHVRGRQDAPVMFEEFADFQCPTCGAMHGVVKQLVEKYPNQVGVAFRDFPLREMHKHAAEAARAAEAAGMQGKFWEMHDMLYDKQAEWKDPDDARTIFVGYAKSLGLDVQRFANDMDSSVVAMRVLADERRGQALGVHATPTFFINGRELQFEQSNTLDKLSAAVDAALAQHK
ncbi:MAG: DsbA family protein [Acidobacteria bacterium]|nr:DsbA family protein [Acidobacteriota bacterium]